MFQCKGPMSRRSFIKVGGLSMGALSGGGTLNLGRLLAAESQAPKADKDFSVILLWAGGGPSHLETFDMKPDAPSEYRGEFKPIRTNVPGMDITELLPRLATRADKYTIVRSLYHNRNEHSGGTARLLSGYPSIANDPITSEFPTIGSVVAKHLEPEVRDLPLYVGNSIFYGGGPGFLGAAYSPYLYKGDPSSPTFSVGELTVPQAQIDQLRRRNQMLQRFDTLRREIDRTDSMSALDNFNRRALDLLTSSRTREAFDLSKEPERIRERYGKTTGGQSLLLARRLVEAGVRFVQISAHFPVSSASSVLGASNWDDHAVNSDIFASYKERMPLFDQLIPNFLDDFYARGLDKHVLFIFCGEFGRTPRISYQTGGKKWPGRDHWCRAMSIFLAGGGMKMGQAIGATNSRGEDPSERIMNSNCLLASIYQRFGIDTHQVNIDKSGRPIPILTDGEPIAELF